MQTQKLTSYLINCWIFIPIFIYFKIVNEYALNIPYRDDYQAILNFIIDYKATSSFTHKVWLLFHQHNEHRIFPSRLMYLWYYNIFGNINFRSLIFIGNLQLVATFLICTSFIRKIGDKFWGVPALVLSLCLFDINSYENSVFAMAAMTNYGVVMFFCAAIYFYNKNKNWQLIAAVICQFLCAFASGNGMLAGLCLVIFNILSKNKSKVIISTVCFVAFTALYFIGYSFAKSSPVADAPANTIVNIVTYFLHMVGAHFSYTYGVELGILILISLIIVGYFLFFKQKKYFNMYAPFVVIALFILGSMAITAKFRLQTGMLSSYASRYFIYTHLLAGILFAVVFYLIKKPVIKWTLTAFAILIFINNYKENYAYAEGGYERQKYRMEVKDFIDYPLKDENKKTIEKTCAMGIYCLDN